MRCDLHVHSTHSGPLDAPLLRHLGTESSSTPEEVYAAARRRGMHLVTLTDHDSIEGALRLAGRSDTFLSEELTAWIGGREVHLGVLDLEERHHGHCRHEPPTASLSSPISPSSACPSCSITRFRV
jgi:predicted metal-dependent phosphoesterase TrpH